MTEQPESASQYIKAQGLPGVTYVADACKIDRQLLHTWYHKRFALFEIIVLGCVIKQKSIKPPFDPLVQCACGWIGSTSKLAAGGCPDCGKEFFPYPPSKGTDDDG